MNLYYYLDVFYTHFLCFVLSVLAKSFCKKKKTFKTGLMNSFILLLTSNVDIDGDQKSNATLSLLGS